MVIWPYEAIKCGCINKSFTALKELVRRLGRHNCLLLEADNIPDQYNVMHSLILGLKLDLIARNILQSLVHLNNISVQRLRFPCREE